MRKHAERFAKQAHGCKLVVVKGREGMLSTRLIRPHVCALFAAQHPAQAELRGSAIANYPRSAGDD